MPVVSEKNTPLTSAGADLGLQGSTPGMDAETEEEKKKRLAALALQQQKSSTSGMASQMLYGGGVGGI